MKKIFLFFVVVLVLLGVSTVPALTETITFEWDANTEADLAGYKFYAGAASETYDHITPIDVGNLTEYTIDVSSWPDGMYYFAVTAYDNHANESGYSNEVSRAVDNTAPADPTGCREKLIIP